MARLVWVDRSGKELGEIAVSGNAQFPRIAHHADRIVYSLADPATGAGDLWIVDTTRNVPSQFTSEPGDDLWPAWSPDDSEIAYSGNGARGRVEILVKPSNGKRAASTLYASPTVKFVNDWSRDGRHILFQQIERQSKTGFDLYALDVDKKAASAVVQTQYNEWGATFSPDGQWIAYGSDRSGRNELYVQLFPGTGPGLQISTRGGSEPQWSEDGKDIYFRSGDDSLCRIDIRTTPVFHVSDAVTLFPLRARWLNIGGPQWQVAEHGNKFLLAELIPEEAPAPITVLR